MRPASLAPLAFALAGLALGAGCGDTLVDHTNTAVRDGGGNLCGEDQLVCDPACTTLDPAVACESCGTPCPDAPANASRTCTQVAPNQGACGYRCDPGYLDTGAGCAAPAALAAGDAFTCALVAGQVHCWGAGARGQLGDATLPEARAHAARVPGVTGATALGAGSQHACAASGSSVRCWGSRAGWGAAGADTATPQVVTALAGGVAAVEQIVAGAAHTCVRLAGGAVKCVGEATSGGGAPALGDGAVALELAAGDAFTCALVSVSGTRSVRCWGADDTGQLGRGSAGSAQATPVTVSLSGTLLHLAAGARHACVATTADPGPTTCWGDNAGNQVSDSTAPLLGPTSNLRVNKPASSAVTEPLFAGGAVSCIVIDDNPLHQLNCWGSDALAAGGPLVGEENHIVGADPPATAAIGAGHGCFVATDGTLRCWGHGASGQLGNEALGDSQSPVLVRGR